MRLTTLRRRSEFRKLSTEGRRVNPSRWLSLSFIENELPTARWGWTIPRQVANATIRNRLKRWGREIIRSYSGLSALEGVDINVYVRPVSQDHYKRMPYEKFREVLCAGFQSVIDRRKGSTGVRN